MTVCEKILNIYLIYRLSFCRDLCGMCLYRLSAMVNLANGSFLIKLQ